MIHSVVPRLTVVPFTANVMGLGPVIAGIYLNLTADRLLKRHHTAVRPFRHSTALVTHGVYGHTRNPMYLGFTLILLGIALLLGSVRLFVIVAFFPMLMDPLYIRAEETMLRDRF